MLVTARRILERRRLRDAEFGASLFGEPAWESLLELYIRESSGLSTTAAQLRAASTGPSSTSERWLKKLEQEGLVRRRAHPASNDSEFVELTDAARTSLERYLAAVGSLTG
jgi:DNA repair protein RadC